MPSLLGIRIRQARKAAGYRNAESFAVALGVSHATVQRWETGKNEPSFSRLAEVATLVGQPLAFFVTADSEVPA